MGIYIKGTLKVDISIKNSDSITHSRYLLINNKKYTYKIKNISKIYETNQDYYQTYSLTINKKIRENEVVDITLLSKKERIIKKIIDTIFC